MVPNIAEILQSVKTGKHTLYTKTKHAELHLGFYLDRHNMLPALVIKTAHDTTGFVKFGDTVLGYFPVMEPYMSNEQEIQNIFTKTWSDITQISPLKNENTTRCIAESLNLHVL